MPLIEFVNTPTHETEHNDWFTATTQPNLTAAVQLIASAGAGFTHYISSFTISSASAQIITLQHGDATRIHSQYVQAGVPFEWVLPRSMEHKCPVAAQRIDILGTVSATVYATIAGFKR